MNKTCYHLQYCLVNCLIQLLVGQYGKMYMDYKASYLFSQSLNLQQIQAELCQIYLFPIHVIAYMGNMTGQHSTYSQTHCQPMYRYSRLNKENKVFFGGGDWVLCEWINGGCQYVATLDGAHCTVYCEGFECSFSWQGLHSPLQVEYIIGQHTLLGLILLT